MGAIQHTRAVKGATVLGTGGQLQNRTRSLAYIKRKTGLLEPLNTFPFPSCQQIRMAPYASINDGEMILDCCFHNFLISIFK